MTRGKGLLSGPTKRLGHPEPSGYGNPWVLMLGGAQALRKLEKRSQDQKIR